MKSHKDLQGTIEDVIISGEWRHSEYWERDKYGYLTEKGWEKALEDTNGIIAWMERKAITMKRAKDAIEAVLAEEKKHATSESKP
jgi:hypothetical protein